MNYKIVNPKRSFLAKYNTYKNVFESSIDSKIINAYPSGLDSLEQVHRLYKISIDTSDNDGMVLHVMSSLTKHVLMYYDIIVDTP